MATTPLSIIRYKYKADRDFHAVQFEGASCSLRDLKRLIVDKSTRSGTHQPRDDYELFISDASTHTEYKENNELIPCNTSVIITRRIRDASEALTQASNQRSVPANDDSVHEYLRQAMLQPSTTLEQKPLPLETLNLPSPQPAEPEMSEDERIKEVVKESGSRYLAAHRPNTCHHCKQPGHRRNQCPLLQTSSSSVSTNDPTPKSDGTLSAPPSSRVVTTQSPYHHPSNPYRHNNYQGNRPSHRGGGYPRPEPLPKRTTGIPRDGLIPVPRHIPGAMRDQTGASVVPRQMAQLIIEQSEKKADALAQLARQFQEKGVLPPAPPASMFASKTADGENPPVDLVCSLCKQIYVDAVIVPCCHESFCDECIRTALVESEEHECPRCHRQRVPIDQINPNPFLRKCVTDWRETQRQKFSLLYVFPSALPTFDADPVDSSTRATAELHRRQQSEESEEAATLSTVVQPPLVRTAPIVIKMQLPGRTPSPQVIAEDEKTAQTRLERSGAGEAVTLERNSSEERSMTINDILPPMNSSESEKSARHTPPSQVAPVSTILSSPPTTTITTMSTAASIVRHYHQPLQMHHRLIYPQQIQPHFYSPPMHVPYPGMMHPYPGPPAFMRMPPVHHLMGVPGAPLNGYHLGPYDNGNLAIVHPPRAMFPETSTLLGHHPASVPQGIPPLLSKDEFYGQQRDLQGIRRSRSSSSKSSNSYSVSRSHRRDYRRTADRRKSVERRRRTRSRSRSRHRRRSPTPPAKERRRSSPRDQRRRRRGHRSPRPPPTVSQSTQRTIVYQRHSSKDRSSRHRSSSPSKVPTDQQQRSSTRDEQESKKRKREREDRSSSTRHRRSEESESKSRRTVKLQ